MQLGQGGLGGLAQDSPLVPFRLGAGAAELASFATANYYSVTGSGTGFPNLAADRAVYALVKVGNGAADQTWFGYCSTDKGYFVDCNNSERGDIFLRSSSNTNFNFQTGLDGYQLLGFARQPGGGLWYTINGKAVAQLVASPNYTDCDSASVFTIGRCNPAVGTFPATVSTLVWLCYVLEGDTSVAAGYANQVNLDDRYATPAALLARITAVGGWELRADRDWTSGNITPGYAVGVTAPTLVKQGTGASQATIERERIYSIGGYHLHDTVPVVQRSGYVEHSEFARLIATTDSTKLRVKCLQSLSGFPNLNGFGYKVNGVFQGSGKFINEFSLGRVIDIEGLSSSSKEVQIIAGMQGLSGGTHLGNFLQELRVPESATFALTAKTVPAKIIVVTGTSIEGQVTNATTAAQQGWTELLRDNQSTHQVVVHAWGFNALKDVCADASNVSVYGDQVVAALNASSTDANANLWVSFFDINDHGLNKWVTVADYKATYAALIDYVHTQKPNALIYIISCHQTSSEGANAGGQTKAQFRTAEFEIATDPSRTSYCTYRNGFVDNTDIIVYPGDVGDGTHLTQQGCIDKEAKVRATLGL